MSTLATKVDTLLEGEVSKVPEQLRKAFKDEIGAIKTKVNDTIKASNDNVENIENVVRSIVNTWIFDFLTSKNYSEYKDLVKSLGTSPLTIEEFRGGTWKPDPRATTPWKRFAIVKNSGIKIGDTVHENATGKDYEVSGIARNIMLQLKGYKGGEPQNPLNFTKKKK